MKISGRLEAQIGPSEMKKINEIAGTESILKFKYHNYRYEGIAFCNFSVFQTKENGYYLLDKDNVDIFSKIFDADEQVLRCSKSRDDWNTFKVYTKKSGEILVSITYTEIQVIRKGKNKGVTVIPII